MVGLVIGILVGGGSGFLLGRYLVLQEQLTTQAVPTHAAPPAASVGDAAAGATVPVAGQPSASSPSEQESPDAETFTLNLAIQGSLYKTLAEEMAGREADILNAQLGRILVWWFDLRRDVLKNDRIQVAYRHVDPPAEIQPLAVRYTSRKNARTYSAYLFQSGGAKYARYYDEGGREIELRIENAPIDEYEQVTELMNMAGRRHKGVDFKCDIGTPVMAPFKSKVIRRNWNTYRNGNCLELRFADSGVVAIFLHLDEVLPETKPGVVVEAGTVVARAGNTGHSTAPHLHYQLQSASGRLLNPYEVHKTKRVELEGEHLARFKAQLEGLKSLLDEESAAGSSPPPSESNLSKATRQ